MKKKHTHTHIQLDSYIKYIYFFGDKMWNVQWLKLNYYKFQIEENMKLYSKKKRRKKDNKQMVKKKNRYTSIVYM